MDYYKSRKFKPRNAMNVARSIPMKDTSKQDITMKDINPEDTVPDFTGSMYRSRSVIRLTPIPVANNKMVPTVSE